MGPQLTISYVSAGTLVTLTSTNEFRDLQPGDHQSVRTSEFRCEEHGHSGGNHIQHWNRTNRKSLYSLSAGSSFALPHQSQLAPNAETHFTIIFTPTTLGFSNGTLQLDATTVALVGSGTQPPALPAYTIGGASGAVAPGTQPNINLTLASPYPLALSGVLTAATSGTLPADPAVQFATGGLTVPFTIPANSTSAVFGAQGTQIGLQTGTVAGTITHKTLRLSPHLLAACPLTPVHADIVAIDDCSRASYAGRNFAERSDSQQLHDLGYGIYDAPHAQFLERCLHNGSRIYHAHDQLQD